MHTEQQNYTVTTASSTSSSNQDIPAVVSFPCWEYTEYAMHKKFWYDMNEMWWNGGIAKIKMFKVKREEEGEMQMGWIELERWVEKILNHLPCTLSYNITHSPITYYACIHNADI